MSMLCHYLGRQVLNVDERFLYVVMMYIAVCALRHFGGQRLILNTPRCILYVASTRSVILCAEVLTCIVRDRLR